MVIYLIPNYCTIVLIMSIMSIMIHALLKVCSLRGGMAVAMALAIAMAMAMGRCGFAIERLRGGIGIVSG